MMFTANAFIPQEIQAILTNGIYKSDRGFLLFAQKYMPDKTMREVYDEVESSGFSPSSLKWERPRADYSQGAYKREQIIIEVASIMDNAEKYPDNDDYKNHLAQIKGAEGLKKLAQSWSDSPEEEPSLDELIFTYNAVSPEIERSSFRELEWPIPAGAVQEDFSTSIRRKTVSATNPSVSYCEYIGSTPSPVVFAQSNGLCQLPAVCIGEVKCRVGSFPNQTIPVYCDPVDSNRCPNADDCINSQQVSVNIHKPSSESPIQTLPWTDDTPRSEIQLFKSSKGVR